MPELPEVEAITKGLSPLLVDKVIRSTWTSNKSLRSQLTDKERTLLLDKKIKRVFRRAKFLVVEFESHYLLVHFGMTGKIITSRMKPDFFIRKNKHIHFSFCTDELFFYFQDVRRFGALYLYEIKKLKKSLLSHSDSFFGMEPLSPNFTAEFAYEKTRGVNRSVKSWIMNGPIAGVGNIYTSEALFRAGINPNLKVKKLGIIRFSRLVASIKYVLLDSIRLGGSTIQNFANIYGDLGEYSNKHLVYGKKSSKCPICNNLLSLKYISQRSSFYCIKCQKI